MYLEDAVHSVRVAGRDSLLYPRFRQTYEEAFPPSERRSESAQDAAFADVRYHLDTWHDGTKFIGFLAWWDFTAYRYVEHLAVSSEARSGGYGKRIMRRWLDQTAQPVYLEIEQVVDELTRRRLEFYLRLGFHETPFRHIQPPYQADENGNSDEGVAMQVLSWPYGITGADHAAFLETLHAEVWNSIK